MPCTAPARGTKAGAKPPFNDSTDNNPCGKSVVSTANGVSVASHSLCVFHLGAKLGQGSFTPPYVMAA